MEKVSDEELEKILNIKSYSWIKVPKHEHQEVTQKEVNMEAEDYDEANEYNAVGPQESFREGAQWALGEEKLNMEQFVRHHIKENSFLIDKVRQLAQEIKENRTITNKE